MRFGRRLLIVLSLVLLASLALSVGAQENLPGVFSEILDVRVVNIEVVVVDRSGQRVTGLVAEDFELIVDGDPVPIEYFTEVRDGDALQRADGGDGPAGVPAAGPGGAIGTSYLVFIDDYYSIHRDRDIVIEALQKQLRLIGPNDRMAIVAYNGQQLEMLSSWSQSIPELERALETSKTLPAGGLKRYAELRVEDSTSVRGFLDEPAPSLRSIGNRLNADELHYAQRIEDHLDRAVAAASSTLRSFGSPPGRKVMLLMAGGWIFDIADFVVDDPRRMVVDTTVPQGSQVMAPLVDTANLLGYTIYSVDVPGMQGSELEDITGRRDLEAGAFTATSGDGPGVRSQNREWSIERSLRYLAEQTGGEPNINGQREIAFERAVADTRSYYWLGYSPQRKGDNELHKVKVEVRRKDLKVRSRNSYLDFSRQREISMAVESALYFGNPPSPHPLLVQIGKPEKSGRRKIIVPLALAIPLDAITLLPSGTDRVSVQLELRVAVLDEDGATADMPVIPIQFSFDPKADDRRFVRYDTKIQMRNKPHDVVIALYDTLSGTILSTSVQVTPN